MVRKVIAGQELLKAAGTVTGKLVRCLGEHGYIDEATADQARDHARKATRDLPMADRLGTLLHDVANQAPAIDPDDIADEDWVGSKMVSGRSPYREPQVISPAPAGRRP